MSQCAFCDRTDTTDFPIPKGDGTFFTLVLCTFHQKTIYNVLAPFINYKPCPECKGQGVIEIMSQGNYIGKKICGYCGGTRVDPKA